MNRRNLSVVAVVILLSTSSGCSGMRNFLFGRGAQCGLCNRVGSPQGNLPQASAPYGPLAAGDCGCNGHLAGDVCPQEATCGSDGAAYGAAMNYSQGYGPIANDPYMGGEVIGSSVVPYDGQYYDNGIVYGQGAVGPGTIVPEGYVPGSSMQDNFDARGDRIIRAEPLPQGAQLLP